jgi:hypothetical protein
MSLSDNRMFAENPVHQAIRTIKENAYFMKKAIESANLREALKYSDHMLSELRTEVLNPKDYYSLFTLIFDELSWLQNNLVSLLKAKKKLNLYETVQYSKKILPRLYLLITAGAAYIEVKSKGVMEVVWDLFRHLKGVQHPLRGLMLRYYFLKVAKEKIEDNEDELNLDEIISLYVMNLREMNSLWVRINSLIEDREKRSRQRKDLAVLVGENLLRLSALEGIDLQVYRTQVLPKVLEIILDTRDKISQEYLFDCLISAFPDDYHLETLSELLEATEKLGRKVNLNSIYLKLMERLAQYAKNKDKEEKRTGEVDVDGKHSSSFIYEQFYKAISSLISKEKLFLQNYLELLAGFMNFTVFFYNGKLEFIDEILSITKHLCDRYQAKNGKESRRRDNDEKVDTSNDPRNSFSDQKTLEHLVSLLTIPMEKLSLLVLKLSEFTSLMELLPVEQQKLVAIQICKAIVASHTYLISERICQNVIRFIYPLFSLIDVQEDELVTLSKVLHFIDAGSPVVTVKLLKLFEAQFQRTDRMHLKLLYPILLNRLIYTIQKSNKIQIFLKEQSRPLDHSHDTTQPEHNVLAPEDQGQTPVEQKPQSNEDWLALFVKTFCKFNNCPYMDEIEKAAFRFVPEVDLALDMERLLEFIHQITVEVEVEHPLLSLQIWLELLVQIDLLAPIHSNEEMLYNCSTHIFNIFENEIGNTKNRIFYFNKIYGYFASLKNSSHETIEQLYDQLKASVSLLLKREDQAKAVLRISTLYSGHCYNETKLIACVKRSFALVQMSQKYERRGAGVLISVIEYLLSFISKGIQAFTVNEVEALLAFFKKNLADIDKSTEEGVEQERHLREHFERVKSYWRVHSPQEEIKQLLASS